MSRLWGALASTIRYNNNDTNVEDDEHNDEEIISESSHLKNVDKMESINDAESIIDDIVNNVGREDSTKHELLRRNENSDSGNNEDVEKECGSYAHNVLDENANKYHQSLTFECQNRIADEQSTANEASIFSKSVLSASIVMDNDQAFDRLFATPKSVRKEHKTEGIKSSDQASLPSLEIDATNATKTQSEPTLHLNNILSVLKSSASKPSQEDARNDSKIPSTAQKCSDNNNDKDDDNDSLISTSDDSDELKEEIATATDTNDSVPKLNMKANQDEATKSITTTTTMTSNLETIVDTVHLTPTNATDMDLSNMENSANQLQDIEDTQEENNAAKKSALDYDDQKQNQEKSMNNDKDEAKRQTGGITSFFTNFMTRSREIVIEADEASSEKDNELNGAIIEKKEVIPSNIQKSKDKFSIPVESKDRNDGENDIEYMDPPDWLTDQKNASPMPESSKKMELVQEKDMKLLESNETDNKTFDDLKDKSEETSETQGLENEASATYLKILNEKIHGHNSSGTGEEIGEKTSDLWSFGEASSIFSSSKKDSFSDVDLSENEEDLYQETTVVDNKTGRSRIFPQPPPVPNPNQALFDILDKTFLSEINTRDCQDPINLLSPEDAKMCFMAFVMTFNPLYPTSAHTNKAAVSLKDVQNPLDFFDKSDTKDRDGKDKRQNTSKKKESEKDAQNPHNAANSIFSYKEDPFHEMINPYVPVDVVHSLWNTVLIQNDKSCFKDQRKDKMKKVLIFIQDILIKNLGLLEIQKCRKIAGKIEDLSINSDEASKASLKEDAFFIRVHQEIHQHYGQYLAYKLEFINDKDMNGALFKSHAKEWNEAASKIAASNTVALVGYNEAEEYTFQILTSNMIRALDLHTAAKTLRSDSFVSSRLSNLGIWKGTVAHIIDVEELLYFNDDIRREENCLTLKEENEIAILAYQKVHENAMRFLKHEEEQFKSVLNLSHSKGNMRNEIRNTTKINEKVKVAAFALSEKYMDIGKSIHLMAVSLGSRGFQSTEIDYYKQALDLKRSAIAHMKEFVEEEFQNELNNHPYNVPLAETLHSVAYIHDISSEKEDAVLCYDEAFRIRKRLLGPDHPDVATTLHNMGALFCDNGEYEVAFEYLDECLRIRELNFGSDDQHVGDTLQWIGNLYREWNDSDQAILYFEGMYYRWITNFFMTKSKLML